MESKGVIIVTGGGGGLGSSIARAAYLQGFPVALIGRTHASLEVIKKSLEEENSKGQKISIHSVDLTNESSVKEIFSKVKAEHISIRALVNNAATWVGTTSIDTLGASEIQKSLDLNFFSALNATIALLKIIGAEPKNDLAIVNVGATASLDSWMEVLPFSIAKSALRGFSRALARDVGPKGIHVAHLIIDGVLNNDRTQKLNASLEKDRFINTDSVADGIMHVINQEKSCWTMEWDVRPYNENW